MFSIPQPVIFTYNPNDGISARPLASATEYDFEERETDNIADGIEHRMYRVIPLHDALETIKRISAAIEAL